MGQYCRLCSGLCLCGCALLMLLWRGEHTPGVHRALLQPCPPLLAAPCVQQVVPPTPEEPAWSEVQIQREEGTEAPAEGGDGEGGEEGAAGAEGAQVEPEPGLEGAQEEEPPAAGGAEMAEAAAEEGEDPAAPAPEAAAPPAEQQRPAARTRECLLRIPFAGAVQQLLVGGPCVGMFLVCRKGSRPTPPHSLTPRRRLSCLACACSG